MPTAKKADDIAELEDRVRRAAVVISTTYRGMSVADMTTMRRRMRDAGVDVQVVKNTLLRIASERAGKAEVSQIVEGPTAMLFAYGDIAPAARAITEYVRTARNSLTITGAFLEGEVITGAGVTDLATLPTRTEMIGRFAGAMQGPIASFAGLLTAVVRDFAGLVDARARQLEEGAGVAA
jgi:large subunit ribosomal protein L10